MVEDNAFRIAVVAVFATVDCSVVPFVDWMDCLAVRTHPDIRMSAPVFLDLRSLKMPRLYASFNFKCHST